jgi:hypothetical protein
MGQRTSVYLDDDLHAAVKASGVPLAELIRRGLTASTTDAQQAPVKDMVSTSCSRLHQDLRAGEPSPGALCMGPGCYQRDTARYGLRRLALCTACAAALQGETYQRPLSPSAARIIGGTAA